MQPLKGCLVDKLQGSHYTTIQGDHSTRLQQKENESSNCQQTTRQALDHCHTRLPNLDHNDYGACAILAGVACLIPIGVAAGSAFAAGIRAAIVRGAPSTPATLWPTWWFRRRGWWRSWWTWSGCGAWTRRGRARRWSWPCASHARQDRLVQFKLRREGIHGRVESEDATKAELLAIVNDGLGGLLALICDPSPSRCV